MDRRYGKQLEHSLGPRLEKTVGRLGQMVGRSRMIVLVAVAAVLMVSLSLFLLGAMQTAISIGEAWAKSIDGEFESVELTIDFLEIVTVMLKAVIFYLIGVGLFSLFISPLNVAIALGIATLNDLEIKILNIVIVIMAVKFLEHFSRWQDSWVALQFGGAFAAVVIAIVLFEFYSHFSSQAHRAHDPETERRSKHDLFERDEEQHDVKKSEREDGGSEEGEAGAEPSKIH